MFVNLFPKIGIIGKINFKMTANYNANHPDNWEQIYTGSFEATYIQGKQIPIYTPIPKTELTLNIDSPILAIHCTSTQYPNSKRYLGNLYQTVIATGIFPTNTLSAKGKSIYSNETVFAEFTQFVDNYNLMLNVNWRVEQISLTIFKYIGERHFEVQKQLTIIETKIDQML